MADARPITIALVMGTRPEAIKLAPLYRELARRPERFRPRLWATAQHRQMLDQVLEAFALKPDRDFDLMHPGQSLTSVTSAVLGALEPALREEQPDAVIVQGDTTTAFAAALAAYYQRVPVGHVEAGLRTHDKFAPYPEEMNRRLVTRLADWHFAPTERAREALLGEGVAADSIHVTGNTIIDALQMTLANPWEGHSPGWPLPGLADSSRLILITGHRRENFGPGFEAICRAIGALAERYPDIQFVYPVHLNPNVREPVERLLGGHANVKLMEPLAYEPFVRLMARAALILTDSGGVQEEAPSLGKPVLVMRDCTERPEAVEAGTARLVGADEARIVTETARLLDDASEYEAMTRAHNPFGDGRAAVRIADILERVL